jgi:hypothetical protein
MTALLLPATTETDFEVELKTRLDFDFFDQLDCLDLTASFDPYAEPMEGAD